jgi:predicted metal-binding membrane protein
MWGAMSAAMMLPVALPAIRYVAFNSLPSRRIRVVATYTVAYISVWLAFGAVSTGLNRYLSDAAGLDRGLLLAVSLVAASGWQISGWKLRALYQCHRTVALPPFGSRADAACVRFALLQGFRCLRSCWALMALMSFTGHAGAQALAVAATLTALIAFEELSEDGTQVLYPSAAVLALAGGLAASGVFYA